MDFELMLTQGCRHCEVIAAIKERGFNQNGQIEEGESSLILRGVEEKQLSSLNGIDGIFSVQLAHR